MNDEQALRLLNEATSTRPLSAMAGGEVVELRDAYERFAADLRAIETPVDTDRLVDQLTRELLPEVRPLARPTSGRSRPQAWKTPWFFGVVAATVVIGVVVLFDPSFDAEAAELKLWNGYATVDRRLDHVERETALVAASPAPPGPSVEERMSRIEWDMRAMASDWGLDLGDTL